MAGGQKMKTHDDDVAALAVAGGSDDESEVPRQKCLALIASLRERAKDLLQVEDQAEIAKRTSRMMLDMLALKRLNQEVFDAIAVRADELEGLKSASELTHLELQNTNYERTHLKHEIPKHRDFPTPELDKIDLVDEKIFRASWAAVAAEKEQAAADENKSPGAAKQGEKAQEENAAEQSESKDSTDAPQEVESAEKADSSTTADPLSNEHALQLARLSHELATRKSLNEKIGALEAQKRKAIEKLEQVNATINSVPELVQRVEDAGQQLAELFPDKLDGDIEE